MAANQDYKCLYCGKVIEPSEILFVKNNTTSAYEDLCRWEFLNKCGMYKGASMADVSQEEADEKRFHRLYHRAWKEIITKRDINGFPKEIIARPCDLLTNEELVKDLRVPPKEVPPGQEAAEIATEAKTRKLTPEQESDATAFSGFQGFKKAKPAQSPTTVTPQNAGMRTPSATSATGNTAESIGRPTSAEEEHMTVRACPHCHCDLPADFGIIPFYSVQLMGGRAAGKTAFLICMHQQLNQQMAKNNLGSAELLGESEKFLRPLIQYYEKTGTPMATPVGQRIFPLIYKVDCNTNSGIQSAYISINDIAGEGIKNDDYLSNHQGLRTSKVLLLIIDPNQLNDGGYYKTYIRMKQGEAPQDRAAQTGANEYYSDALHAFLNSSGNRVRSIMESRDLERVFVVITKFDMPMMTDRELFGKGDITVTQDTGTVHRNGINLTVVGSVHKEVNMYVDKVMEMVPNTQLLVRQVASAFHIPESRVIVSAVSTNTLDDHPKKDANGNRKYVFSNKPEASAPKHRIIEPFLLLLGHHKLLPVKQSAPAKKK